MGSEELCPKLELEWEGKKYTCSLDLGWAYRLDTECGINVLDFAGMQKKALGPKYFISFLWAALVEHFPNLRPAEVAAKAKKRDIAMAMGCFMGFMSGITSDTEEKKTEPANH